VAAVLLYIGLILPFSHKEHARLPLKCQDCHPKATSAEKAGIPAPSLCIGCHPKSETLRSLVANKAPLPRSASHKLADFVIFSHQAHAANQPCLSCHNSIIQEARQDEVMYRMSACVDCHRAKKASTDCTRCHELGQ